MALLIEDLAALINVTTTVYHINIINMGQILQRNQSYPVSEETLQKRIKNVFIKSGSKWHSKQLPYSK